MVEARPRAQRWRGLAALAVEIAAPLLLLGALEGGFRAYVRGHEDLPLPHLMKSSIDTGKYLAFRRMEERPRPLDVLFLGLSPMMRVSGRQLRDFMSGQRREPFRSFNFAAPFHSVELDRRLLDSVVVPIEKPAVVVYGIMPLNLLNEPKSVAIDAEADDLPAFALQGGNPASRLRGFLTDHLLLLQYRDVLRDLASPTAPAAKDPWIRRARRTDAFGDPPMIEVMWQVAGIAEWEHKYEPRLAHFDSLLADSLLFERLHRLAEFCRARGIRLVVMAAPVHPLFLELLPNGRRDYDAFLARLRETAADAGVPLFDPAGGGIGRPELFQDTHHHNAAGTRWLTEQIGRFLVDNDLLARGGGAAAQKSTTG